MGLKLISFRLCPFVRRSMIVMALKAIQHETEYIDLADPPDWFVAISPFRRVPVLMVDDRALFESSAINEYLDELGPGSLHPRDPFERARHRGWIEFGNHAMWHAAHLTTHETREGFQAAVENMWRDFDRLESAMTEEPYFAGDRLCLVDASFAPLFQQLDLLAALNPEIIDDARHPRVRNWWRALCAHQVIADSLGDGFAEAYHALIHRRRGFMARFVDGARFAGQAPGRY